MISLQVVAGRAVAWGSPNSLSIHESNVNSNVCDIMNEVLDVFVFAAAAILSLFIHYYFFFLEAL